jgi:hypothetical protein
MGSEIVDVVVGVLFVFLVFSLIVSGVNEALTRVFAWRSRHLWLALRTLLDGEEGTLAEDPRPPKGAPPGETWTSKLYAHPLIRQLEGRLGKRSRLSHIPATDFARALVDVIVPGANGQLTVEQLRQRAVSLGGSPLAAPLLAMVNECQGRVDLLTRDIGDWFDARMGALSASYQHHAKWVLAVVGVVVALIFNVDAIGATQRLYRDDALRTAVAEQATAVSSVCEGQVDIASCTRDQVDTVNSAIRLPVGWPDPDGVDGIQVLGWLIAGMALGQGAPFWFDLLRKAGKLRG